MDEIVGQTPPVPSDTEAPPPGETMTVQMGPSHPATHGTVRFLLEIEGERIDKMDVEFGYLHRGFEKMCENSTWTQVLPYTDRLNYVSPLVNNVGYALAVEKLIGIRDPERSQYLRVIASEINRITDHLTLVGAMGLELGAFTAFLYAIEARDLLWDRITEMTGARMTTSYTRIGGVVRDIPPGWTEKLIASLERVAQLREEIDALLSRNRIFLDRTRGVGAINAKDAIALNFTGPCLRACGVDYDVRKDHPYLVYDRFDFEIPIGTQGDSYDRYLMRVEEMRQSERILVQALKQMPEGPVLLDDWRWVLPPKSEVYGSIEGMIAHFKHIMEGTKVPKGEVYAYTESPNGELGWYVVSDGSGRPYKLGVRSPGFPLLQGMPRLCEGGLIADIVPTFDSINMIGGEVER